MSETKAKDYTITEKRAKGAAEVCWAWLEKKVEEKGDRSFASVEEAFGAITEEYLELVEAVRSNKHMNVRHEIRDLFVPCVFELATRPLNRLMPIRIQVTKEDSHLIVQDLQNQLLLCRHFTSIHEILGKVTLDYRALQDALLDMEAGKNQLRVLALTCVRGMASLDSHGFMDW